ncbi:unnamed protein product [Boreogadus saida]
MELSAHCKVFKCLVIQTLLRPSSDPQTLLRPSSDPQTLLRPSDPPQTLRVSSDPSSDPPQTLLRPSDPQSLLRPSEPPQTLLRPPEDRSSLFQPGPVPACGEGPRGVLSEPASRLSRRSTAAGEGPSVLVANTAATHRRYRADLERYGHVPQFRKEPEMISEPTTYNRHYTL